MRGLVNFPVRYLVFVGLVTYCVTLVLMTGNIGFQGDDWYLLSVPYWHEFPASIWTFISLAKRPIIGAYWITLFEVFGFNKPVFHFFSLLLLGLASMLMGACLHSLFPGKPAVTVCSVLFAFFLPTVSCLTYVMHNDNSRLCLLLFWGSVFSFQRWSRHSQSWMGLTVPVLLYYGASLTHEAAAFLIFAVPLFVWPIHLRHQDNLSHGKYLFRLGVGMVAGVLLLALSRAFGLAGGPVSIRHLIPPLDLVVSYVTTLPRYILAPFAAISADAWTWMVGVLVALFAASLLFGCSDRAQRIAHGKSMIGECSLWYALLLGAVISGLGAFPYLMAGYGAGVGFHGASRIYSAGSFGVAMLFAPLAAGSKAKKLFSRAKFAAVIIVAFMAMFHADLRQDWQEASRVNDALWASFRAAVPDVAPGTTFLFLDLQSYIGNRAVVFGGMNGLREFIRILYDRRDVDAFYLYLYADNFVDSEGRLAIASPEGVVARGSDPNNPIPLESLLIFQRRGSQLVLLDSITSDARLAAIHWDRISVLSSNPNRVLHTGDTTH